MERRDFIKTTGLGLTALVVGSKIPGLSDNPAIAATQTLDFDITDAVKEMSTFNTGKLPDGTVVGTGNPATCYFWIYKSNTPNLPPECPGPIIFATQGDTITITLRNKLKVPASMFIKGMFNSGSIAPGAVVTKSFVAKTSGTYLYFDANNAPVNRVMGLHGAFIVMPKRAVPGHAYTPYDVASPNVQQLFDDLGTAPWWPGLRWSDGDPATDTQPLRQQIWLMHQASPKLFAEVGNWDPAAQGRLYPAATFMRKFLHDPYNPVHNPFNPAGSNNVPQYFTMSGQSGHFSHNSPWICPYSRVGEPILIRLLNAGLWHHSTHIHANHIFVLCKNNSFNTVTPEAPDNPIWVDVYTSMPLDTYDWLVPFMRPPDVPNDLGIGRDDLETSIDVTNTALPLGGYGLANPAGPLPFRPADIPASVAKTTWPPEQELQMFIPNVGSRLALAQDGHTVIDCAVRLSPVCYPMHDHSEPSQVAQGGNYNMGLISGIVFTGDRKGAKAGQPGVITFPDRPTTGDPMTPVAHGPNFRDGSPQLASKEFKMPSIP